MKYPENNMWNSTLIKNLNDTLIDMRGLMIQENAKMNMLCFYRLKTFIITWIILFMTKVKLFFHIGKNTENHLTIAFSKILMVFCNIIKEAYKYDKIGLIAYEIYRNHNIAYIMNSINDYDIIRNYLEYECRGNQVYDEDGFKELINNNKLYDNLWNQISCLISIDTQIN